VPTHRALITDGEAMRTVFFLRRLAVVYNYCTALMHADYGLLGLWTGIRVVAWNTIFIPSINNLSRLLVTHLYWFIWHIEGNYQYNESKVGLHHPYLN